MAKAALLAGFAFAAPAIAQDDPRPGGNSITVGLGAAVIPTYEGSDDYRVIPAAAARGTVSGFNFSLIGTRGYLDLIRNKPGDVDIQLGPVVALGLNRTSGIKDPQVKALGKLDTAVEVGGYAGIGKTGIITSAYDTLSFNVAYRHDVAGAHDSYIITPALNYGTPLSITTYVGISASADIVGDKYARYYFGVTPAGAAASGLSAYTPKGGVKDVNLSLIAGKSLSGDIRHGLAIFAFGSYEKLLGDFKRSPIVATAGDSNQWYGGIGLGYTF